MSSDSGILQCSASAAYLVVAPSFPDIPYWTTDLCSILRKDGEPHSIRTTLSITFQVTSTNFNTIFSFKRLDRRIGIGFFAQLAPSLKRLGGVELAHDDLHQLNYACRPEPLILKQCR